MKRMELSWIKGRKMVIVYEQDEENDEGGVINCFFDEKEVYKVKVCEIFGKKKCDKEDRLYVLSKSDSLLFTLVEERGTKVEFFEMFKNVYVRFWCFYYNENINSLYEINEGKSYVTCSHREVFLINIFEKKKNDINLFTEFKSIIVDDFLKSIKKIFVIDKKVLLRIVYSFPLKEFEIIIVIHLKFAKRKKRSVLRDFKDIDYLLFVIFDTNTMKYIDLLTVMSYNKDEFIGEFEIEENMIFMPCSNILCIRSFNQGTFHDCKSTETSSAYFHFFDVEKREIIWTKNCNQKNDENKFKYPLFVNKSNIPPDLIDFCYLPREKMIFCYWRSENKSCIINLEIWNVKTIQKINSFELYVSKQLLIIPNFENLRNIWAYGYEKIIINVESNFYLVNLLQCQHLKGLKDTKRIIECELCIDSVIKKCKFNTFVVNFDHNEFYTSGRSSKSYDDESKSDKDERFNYLLNCQHKDMKISFSNVKFDCFKSLLIESDVIVKDKNEYSFEQIEMKFLTSKILLQVLFGFDIELNENQMNDLTIFFECFNMSNHLNFIEKEKSNKSKRGIDFKNMFFNSLQKLYYDKEINSDSLTLISKDGTKYKVHQEIFIIRSNFFQKCLDFKGRDYNEDKNELSMIEFDSYALSFLVELIYLNTYHKNVDLSTLSLCSEHMYKYFDYELYQHIPILINRMIDVISFGDNKCISERIIHDLKSESENFYQILKDVMKKYNMTEREIEELYSGILNKIENQKKSINIRHVHSVDLLSIQNQDGTKQFKVNDKNILKSPLRNNFAGFSDQNNGIIEIESSSSSEVDDDDDESSDEKEEIITEEVITIEKSP